MPSSEKTPSGAEKIRVKPLSTPEKPVRRTFPGPRQAAARLRVAIDRAAYADLVAHAKESLNAEVCGVLVGQICDDGDGAFVHVEALIRGNAAAQGATHVTFTQATWDAIHQTLEHDHPKLRIVGWYHTHPGFGVEFSEMDLFIQRNFFSGPTQIALVTDPMNGAVAIAVNTVDGIEYLPRFWVDAREVEGKVPAGVASASSASTNPSGAPAGAPVSPDSVKVLEARIGQLIEANDEMRTLVYRVIFFLGTLLAVGIVAVVGYAFYRQYSAPLEPPRVNSVVPIPVKVGDKNVIMGVAITEWDVPAELNALMIQVEERRREAAEKAAKEALAKLEAAVKDAAGKEAGKDLPKPAENKTPEPAPKSQKSP